MSRVEHPFTNNAKNNNINKNSWTFFILNYLMKMNYNIFHVFFLNKNTYLKYCMP